MWISLSWIFCLIVDINNEHSKRPTLFVVLYNQNWSFIILSKRNKYIYWTKPVIHNELFSKWLRLGRRGWIQYNGNVFFHENMCISWLSWLYIFYYFNYTMRLFFEPNSPFPSSLIGLDTPFDLVILFRNNGSSDRSWRGGARYATSGRLIHTIHFNSTATKARFIQFLHIELNN